jgi:hypothetical protein
LSIGVLEGAGTTLTVDIAPALDGSALVAGVEAAPGILALTREPHAELPVLTPEMDHRSVEDRYLVLGERRFSHAPVPALGNCEIPQRRECAAARAFQLPKSNEDNRLAQRNLISREIFFD